MKRKTSLLLLLVLLCVGCAETPISIWTLTGQDTDFKGLVGAEFQGIEVGGVFVYDTTSEIEWGPEFTGAGFYIAGYPSWLLVAEDTTDPAPPLIDLLDGLTAEPYGRIEWLDTKDNEDISNLQPQWVIGTRFLLLEDGSLAIAVEYSDGDTGPTDTFVGMNYKRKF